MFCIGIGSKTIRLSQNHNQSLYPTFPNPFGEVSVPNHNSAILNFKRELAFWAASSVARRKSVVKQRKHSNKPTPVGTKPSVLLNLNTQTI